MQICFIPTVLKFFKYLYITQEKLKNLKLNFFFSFGEGGEQNSFKIFEEIDFLIFVLKSMKQKRSFFVAYYLDT